MIGKQLYVTSENIRQDIHPVLNSEKATFIKKPARGTGLWTSTFREETQDSGWIEWCRWENFDEPYNKNWFLLTPNNDVRLYIVDGIQDLLDMLRDYEWTPPFLKNINDDGHLTRYYTGIDFERMSLEYDGIHLTEVGNAETHLSYPHDLNAWDCESILWFRWCFTEVNRIEVPQPITVE